MRAMEPRITAARREVCAVDFVRSFTVTQILHQLLHFPSVAAVTSSTCAGGHMPLLPPSACALAWCSPHTLHRGQAQALACAKPLRRFRSRCPV